MRQTLRIATLAWAIVWFGVFLPGHTRGVIKLPGTPTEACESCESKPSCCDKPRADDDASHSRHKSSPDHCAVCELVAKLDTPVAIDLSLPPAGLVELLPPTTPQRVTPARYASTLRGRAPPVA
ncbi:MAG: hypothetical protein GC159_20135 [Phycisphaera sp.]|nr:hypothetical protein [Phycisphaera sp.]